ncbi:MAG: hypothetical protein DRI30_00170 [Chloroflexi bacterium]|nr:MAG: hypothetical protein DRI30_00170 [Chloroflexota bacterium]
MTQRIKLAQDYLPWGVRVAAGRVAGQSHNHKFGYNAAAGTADTVWLQDGAYTWQAAAAVLDITSTDNVEDIAAGDGALTVTIEGLDADFAEISSTVTMTGQTAVLTTGKSFLRVNRMYVATAGVDGFNAGIIYASTGTQTTGTPTVASTIRATIGAGLGQTQQAFYTVPAGKQAFVQSITYTSTHVSASCTFDFLIREAGSTVWLNKGRTLVLQGTHVAKPDVPQTFAAGTDIEIQGTASTSTVPATAELDILLLDV